MTPTSATSLTARLTAKQWDVACLIANAWTTKSIATRLGMSDGNVERHVCNIARAWHLDPSRNLRVQIAAVVWLERRKSA